MMWSCSLERQENPVSTQRASCVLPQLSKNGASCLSEKFFFGGVNRRMLCCETVTRFKHTPNSLDFDLAVSLSPNTNCSNCNFLLARYLLTKFVFSALALKKDIGGWPLGPPPPIPFHSKPVTRTHAEPPPAQIYATLPHSTSETGSALSSPTTESSEDIMWTVSFSLLICSRYYY